MPTVVDDLQIELNAHASSANDAIDKLVGKLDKLSTALGKINGSGITGVANGIERLGKSMQTVNSISSKSFTRLADNIQKLGNINVYNLNSSASALSNVTRAFNQLGGVTQSAQQVGNLANSLSKLGSKTVANASQNIPILANNLNYLMQVLSKAPAVSQNVINLTNSLANLTSQGARVGSSSNSIVRGLNNIGYTSAKTSRKTFSLASAFGALYANFFLITRGIKGVLKSIGETTDYIESFNYYTVAFDKIASEWDDKYEDYGTENAKKYTNAFVTQMSDSFSKLSGLKLDLSDDLESGILSDTGMKNLGLNLKEVTQYASQLASVTNSVGQTGEVSLMTADAFTKLAGDMSSLFNVDFSTVANNLQSALIGQSRSVYKYGIDITNATLQTYAYQMGLEKAVSEMTQMEKMQLRMIAILDQSKVSWGDLADTINTPANMIRQLSNNFKEASMVLGQLFLPLLNKVLPVINGVVIAIKNLLVSIAGFAGINIPLDDIGQGFMDTNDDILELEEGMENATSSAKKLKNQLQGFDKLNNLTTSNAANVNGAIGGTIDLSSQIKDATEEYQNEWNKAYKEMENTAMKFAEKVTKAFEPIRKFFEDISIGDFFSAGNDITTFGVNFMDLFVKAIESVDWAYIGELIGDFFRGLDWEKIYNGIGEVMAAGLVASFKAAFGFGKGSNGNPIFSPAEIAKKIGVIGGLERVYEIIKGFRGKIWSYIVDFLSPITSWVDTNVLKPIESKIISFSNMVSHILSGVLIVIQGAWGQLAGWIEENVVKKAIGVLSPFVEEAKRRVINPFYNAWKDFTDRVGNLFTSLSSIIRNTIANGLNNIISSMENGINNMIGGINALIQKFNTFVQGFAQLQGKNWKDINLISKVSFNRVSAYENGGFPEDGWFRASKGEYFGSFDDGTSVIANNNQIISGISNGVKSANAEQNALLREQNALLRQILAKDTGISTRDIFNAVRSENRDYINRNGESAFAF